MIHLTAEQRQALQQTGEGVPVPLLDPQTSRTYFLLPSALYEQVRHQLESTSTADTHEVPLGIRRSREALLRDLPELLKNRKLEGQWVAYHGDQRLGFGRIGWKLYHECLRRGLTGDEFYVGLIAPHEPEPVEVEHSLFEVDATEEDRGGAKAPRPRTST